KLLTARLDRGEEALREVDAENLTGERRLELRVFNLMEPSDEFHEQLVARLNLAVGVPSRHAEALQRPGVLGTTFLCLTHALVEALESQAHVALCHTNLRERVAHLLEYGGSGPSPDRRIVQRI